jgi:LPPG:FO 2-phospho-L-lactate transferase
VIVALAGGVGGAKLAQGLQAALPAGALTVIVNTGDDFEHLGLAICPDLDTVTYTLGGLNDRVRGWGVHGESWAFMDALKRLGGEDWFLLGDQDLATHVLRTQALRSGRTLSQVTAEASARLGSDARILPMSDDPVRSVVETDEGALPFQHYFVRRRCEPRFTGIRFEGAEHAKPAPGVIEALEDPALEAIILCPSNPVLSIAPILAVPGIAERLRTRRAPCVAVSPFIGGRAVKGPAAKIMEELGLAPDAPTLAQRYEGLIDGLVIDAQDAPAALPCLATDTLMRDEADQARLAAETLAFARSLGK